MMMMMDDWCCTSSLHHAALQYLLHPGGHVGDILGDSLDPLHQAGWLKPAHTHTHNNTQTLSDKGVWEMTVVTQCKLNLKQSAQALISDSSSPGAITSLQSWARLSPLQLFSSFSCVSLLFLLFFPVSLFSHLPLLLCMPSLPSYISTDVEVLVGDANC